jgi:hypothetical protein
MIVDPVGRGFPPDVAKRKLAKRCKAEGCPCDPVYMAGIGAGLLHKLLTGQDPQR